MSDNSTSLLIKLSKSFLKDISSFQVVHPNTLIPYGLKPHTRSISWLAESIVSQNIKSKKEKYGVEYFEEPESDIGVWDFKIRFEGSKEMLYVNFKVTNVKANKQHNDMSSIKKLVKFFEDNKKKKLFYLIFPIEFNNNTISFVDNFICGEYIKMKNFYLNPRNEHIQAYYDVENIDRTYEQFYDLLLEKQKKGKKIFLK